VTIKVFRWKAIGPLLLALIAIGVLVVIFAEPVVRDTTEDVSTDLLGTQVDVRKLDLRPREIGADLWQIEVADPFDVSRNLVEAGSVHLTVDPEALAEKKLVVRNLTLRGMQFGTRRETPARPADGNGFAPQMVRAVRQWTSQFDVPLLKLTPIDTIRALALDPSKLGTVRAAAALAARTDSTRRAIEQGLRAVPVGPTVDSARALVARLDTLNPRRLGIEGTREAVASIQRSIRQVQETRRQIETIGKELVSGVDRLGAGLEEVDEARRRDYAFARSLLQLPSFAAPEIGKAFFGQVSVERFQQAMYWVQLGRRYMPPGLLPRETSGPDRLRMAGSTVQFPKERSYPAFLLEAGNVDFTVEGDGLLAGAYAATVQGLTSAPALYGKPTVISARRRAEGRALASLSVDAVLDHLTARTRDSISAVANGVGLPAFTLPGLPVRLDPGSGRSGLTFVMRGDEIRGRWSIASDRVQWAVDTSARGLNQLERVVWRVLSGLDDLRVTAELSGTVRAPRLAVSTNLDQAVSTRLQAVVGEELARAEQRVRAEVDKIVAAKTEEVRLQVAAVETEGRRQVETERKRLEAVEEELRGRLKQLTGGIQLPGLKLR
jgi:uncharacterized protein (TIGR03545 family)